jgi:alpha-D-ribose 1-methylphosphonate 5-triphosphate synthase subunit PhnH
MSDQQFPNNVIEASHAFRTIMGAVSRPGRISRFHAAQSAPSPLWATSATVVRTLCDFQTPVWFATELRDEAVRQFVRFHTGAPIADRAGDASFIFVNAASAENDPSLFAQGTHEYPDRSATLVIQASALSNTGEVELSGPGIPLPLKFHAEGVTQAFWEAMAENHARFPLGVDVIFVSQDSIAALPRSTAIHLQETV